MHTLMVEPDLHLLPAFARCGICGKGWDNDDNDMATVVVQEQGEEILLTDFVGQSLDQARDTLMQRGEQGGVLYELFPYILHRSEHEPDTVEWTYVIRSGDSGLALVTSYGHPECHDDFPQ